MLLFLHINAIHSLHLSFGMTGGFDNRICVIDGVHADIPKLVFTAKDVNFCKTNAITCGIDKIAKLVESSAKGVIVIETGKNKSNFPSSLYSISEMIDPYEILCSKDSLTTHIPKAFASSEDWKYVLSEFQSYPSWKQLISAKVGNAHSLDIVISNYRIRTIVATKDGYGSISLA